MSPKKPVKKENAWLEELKKINSNINRLDSKLEEVISKLDELVKVPNFVYFGITVAIWSLAIGFLSYHSTIGEISKTVIICFLVLMFLGLLFTYGYIFSLWSKLLKRKK